MVLYPGIPFSIMNAVIPFDPAAKSVFAYTTCKSRPRWISKCFMAAYENQHQGHETKTCKGQWTKHDCWYIAEGDEYPRASRKYQCLSRRPIRAPHLIPIDDIATVHFLSFAFHTDHIRTSWNYTWDIREWDLDETENRINTNWNDTYSWVRSLLTPRYAHHWSALEKVKQVNKNIITQNIGGRRKKY